MANRVLRDFTDSERVDLLSACAERFYTRLMMKADDFGRFFEDSRLLLSNLFPLKIGSDRENVSITQIEEWKNECVTAQLLTIYEVNGKKYISINNFGQRLRRMVSKFPDPPTNVSDSPPESETETNPKQNPKQKQKKPRNFVPPSMDDVKDYFFENGFPIELAERAFKGYSAANWHDSRGKPVLNWKQKMINVWFKPENKIVNGTVSHNGQQQQTAARNSSNNELAAAVAKRHGITQNGSSNGD